jgi:hypothetical protein
MTLRYDWFWFAIWLVVIAAATVFALGVKP